MIQKTFISTVQRIAGRQDFLRGEPTCQNGFFSEQSIFLKQRLEWSLTIQKDFWGFSAAVETMLVRY